MLNHLPPELSNSLQLDFYTLPTWQQSCCDILIYRSIIVIKEKVASGSFDFKLRTIKEVSTEIFKMNHKKSSTGSKFGFLKENLDTCATTLTKTLNSCIFSNELKLVVFKSVDSTAKKNYRHISILDSVSKLFEKLIQCQLDLFYDDRLSDHLCGYRKGYSTQYGRVH